MSLQNDVPRIPNRMSFQDTAIDLDRSRVACYANISSLMIPTRENHEGGDIVGCRQVHVARSVGCCSPTSADNISHCLNPAIGTLEGDITANMSTTCQTQYSEKIARRGR